ncbi:hypothetical protein OHB41_03765 [Streptomyces sp. NBC_01571]|uniref:hypothetical protein n=1 Tax=Streptomyces sp. NBC_01571 TaxID=2975883 RepID=UPI00225C3AFB|nr:hypothetical protein [Streptomyces sp. NBC_01571]MCX4572316.1 hypothetical protein [Streptomyces sp. NBC_01571]
MSDLESLGNPEHKCSDACGPYEPLADRDLESLEESAHIDTLYAELNLVREHAALMFLALQAHAPDLRVPVRTLSVLLDLSEVEAVCLLTSEPQTPEVVVQHAVNVAGEDGYVGQAMAAVFRVQMLDMEALDDEDE